MTDEFSAGFGKHFDDGAFGIGQIKGFGIIIFPEYGRRIGYKTRDKETAVFGIAGLFFCVFKA